MSVSARFVTAVSIIAIAPYAIAMPATEIVALSGDTAPDGNGTMDAFNAPQLNNLGQVSYRGILAGTSGGTSDDLGMFLKAPSSPTIQIVREGQASIDGDGVIAGISTYPILNDVGQMTFAGFLAGNSGGAADNSRLYVSDATGTLTEYVREGQSAPDGNGFLESFNTPTINNAGQIAFTANLRGTSGGTSDDRGYFVADGNSSISQIVREGESVPDGNGTYTGLTATGLNASGQATYLGYLDGTSGGNTDNIGIYRSSALGPTVQIARGGEASNNASDSFRGGYINDLGQVAYFGVITGRTNDQNAIFLDDGVTRIEIVTEGDPVPGTANSFNYFEVLDLNNTGQVLFSAADGGPSQSLYLGTEFGVFPVARINELVPGGGAFFTGIYSGSLNDSGQVTFQGSLSTGVGVEGLYFYDPTLGIVEIAREGDAMLGSTVHYLSLTPATNGRDGLNDNGQVVYNFVLDDGRSGIALWTVPEPSSLVMLGLSALALLRRRS